MENLIPSFVDGKGKSKRVKKSSFYTEGQSPENDPWFIFPLPGAHLVSSYLLALDGFVTKSRKLTSDFLD